MVVEYDGCTNFRRPSWIKSSSVRQWDHLLLGFSNAKVSTIIMNTTPPHAGGCVVFSGGSAANSLVDVFNKIIEYRKCSLSYIIPISDNGGSSSELIRVFGGPGIGDTRSKLCFFELGCNILCQIWFLNFRWQVKFISHNSKSLALNHIISRLSTDGSFLLTLSGFQTLVGQI